MKLIRTPRSSCFMSSRLKKVRYCKNFSIINYFKRVQNNVYLEQTLNNHYTYLHVYNRTVVCFAWNADNPPKHCFKKWKVVNFFVTSVLFWFTFSRFAYDPVVFFLFVRYVNHSIWSIIKESYRFPKTSQHRYVLVG